MKIYVKQKGKKYNILLMDGTEVIKEQTATTIEGRDKIIWELTDIFNVLDVVMDEAKTTKKSFKYSPIPTIPVFDEEDAKFFFEEERSFVYARIVQAVKEGIKANVNSIRLFELNGTGVYITSQKENWKSGLQDALDYYIECEHYEKCSEVQDLMILL
jgi:hypothetical protein